ncbi:hypothetical protein HPHPH3_0584 [Helicobacter pylori Hp H-3]|nr:hypothetical protein HPHPH3_0584 [Helicobacter pylori Hp H-3]
MHSKPFIVFKSYYIKAIELSQNTPIPLNKVTKPHVLNHSYGGIWYF